MSENEDEQDQPQPEDSQTSAGGEGGRFGRLRERAQERGKGVAKRAGDLLQSAKEGAAGAGRQGSEALAAAWTRAGKATSGAIDWGRELPGELRELFVRECSVPVYLLPTGVGRADFMCRFDFHDAVEQLEHGIMVRPRLQVWAARHDVDRGRLAQILKAQFRAQLDQERRKHAATHDEKLREMRREATALEAQQDTAERKVGAGVRRLSIGLIGMFFVANPLFDLVLLAFALFGGGQVITRIGPWIRTAFSSTASKNKVDKEEKRLTEEMDRELSASNEAFRRAVDDLDVRVHRDLNALLMNFAEVELVTVPAAPTAQDEDAPDIRPLLNEQPYKARVPSHLHVLVDAHAG